VESKGAMRATEHYPRAADQVPEARSFVRHTLTSWGITERLDDVVLMTSELFTNAVLHGDGVIGVSVRVPPGRIRVEVTDDGTFGDQATGADDEIPPEQVTGRGLVIVDRLADTWGGGHDPSGRTCVWLEVDRPPDGTGSD
jgi:serine/threonine-protein kinase RsbW